MYDPFATPGATPANPQPAVAQVMPNPVPLAQNNALAAIANRIRANAVPMTIQRPFDLAGFRAAMDSYRANRPTIDGPKTADFMQQMEDYRATRPMARDFRTMGR